MKTVKYVFGNTKYIILSFFIANLLVGLLVSVLFGAASGDIYPFDAMFYFMSLFIQIPIMIIIMCNNLHLSFLKSFQQSIIKVLFLVGLIVTFIFGTSYSLLLFGRSINYGIFFLERTHFYLHWYQYDIIEAILLFLTPIPIVIFGVYLSLIFNLNSKIKSKSLLYSLASVFGVYTLLILIQEVIFDFSILYLEAFVKDMIYVLIFYVGFSIINIILAKKVEA